MLLSTHYRSFSLLLLLFFLINFAQAQVPAQPTQIADRMGLYAWGFESSAYNALQNPAQDRLNWAADRVAEVGSRTIRVTLPGDVYGLPAAADLAATAANPAYDRLFSDPRNSVIVEQGGRRMVAEKSAEATGEILATLPADLQPGFAIAYVTNSSGQESKAYALTISRSAFINRKPIRRGSRLGFFGTDGTSG